MSKAATINPLKNYFTVACKSGKRSYPDRATAKSAAKELAKKGKGNMRPYVCWDCDQYHICHPHVRNGVR